MRKARPQRRGPGTTPSSRDRSARTKKWHATPLCAGHPQDRSDAGRRDGKSTRRDVRRAHGQYPAAFSKVGKLALAGPFMQDPEGWRGLFVFAVNDIEEAKAAGGDRPGDHPGRNGGGVPPWYYGSAALMLVRDAHDRIATKR